MHLRCFCHILQLVIRDFLKAIKCQNLNRLISKFFKLSNKYHQETIFCNYLIWKGYNAICKPVVTRWNSELKTLRSICIINPQDLQTACNLA